MSTIEIDSMSIFISVGAPACGWSLEVKFRSRRALARAKPSMPQTIHSWVEWLEWAGANDGAVSFRLVDNEFE